MKKIIFYSILILVLIGIMYFKNRGIKEYFSVNRKLEKISLENQNLEKENKHLKLVAKKLKNNLKYIEKIAREKYNMIKDNEFLIKINRSNIGKEVEK